MAEITAKTVMDLRAKTNAGMMDCKKALAEADGDMEKAEDILRKKGIAKMETRADRASKEGVIHAVLGSNGTGTLVEVNCETDFVSKNESFRDFVNEIAEHINASSAETLEALHAEPYTKGQGSVDEAVKAKGSQMGEVTVVRRFARYAPAANAAVTTYLHLGGRIGVIIEVAAGKAETLATDGYKALVKDLTLQITAANPEYLNRSEVPEAITAREKEIYADSDRLKGKPAAALESILNGMLNKFFSQKCLLEQGFIRDQDQTVESIIAAAGKELGDTLSITRFVRFAVGEELKA